MQSQTRRSQSLKKSESVRIDRMCVTDFTTEDTEHTEESQRPLSSFPSVCSVFSVVNFENVGFVFDRSSIRPCLTFSQLLKVPKPEPSVFRPCDNYVRLPSLPGVSLRWLPVLNGRPHRGHEDRKLGRSIRSSLLMTSPHQEH